MHTRPEVVLLRLHDRVIDGFRTLRHVAPIVEASHAFVGFVWIVLAGGYESDSL